MFYLLYYKYEYFVFYILFKVINKKKKKTIMSCKLWKLTRSFSKRYIPPITSSSPNLPETPNEIVHELSKQESLLNQIHSEMNAGFVSKKREEQLWEVQRIITQLKVL